MFLAGIWTSEAKDNSAVPLVTVLDETVAKNRLY